MTKQSQESTIIREIKLIERYAAKNEANDMRFRSFVLHDLALNNPELNEKVRVTTDSVWKEIDCLTCGRCCRFLQVTVDDEDVLRLARRLKCTVHEFTARFVRTATDGCSHLASTPCPFLKPDNRCSVYEDRPKSCRDFPYLYEGDFRSRMLFLMEYLPLCPILFNVWDRLKREFTVRNSEKPRKRNRRKG